MKKTKVQKKSYRKKTISKKINNMTVKDLEKVVKNVNDKNVEDKQAYHSSGDSLILFNSQINQLGDYQVVIPTISKGAQENQRIGDKISPKKLNIKGYIRFNPVLTGNIATAAYQIQVGVRMMVLSSKTRSNYADMASSTSPLLGLLRKGGSTVPFTGLISDLFAPINNELWTTHHNKVFYLTQTFNNFATQVGYWETDIKNQIKFFNLNVKVKSKTFRYDDDTQAGLSPTNFAPTILLGYCFLNGASADVVSTNLGLQYITTLDYQDE